ncbi:hypothetical protein ASN18_0850 [Candidatus Magnetominusculus xianensis]|uniref:Uncharacterized protein n=1 Tax=Candidatus Magnetominusculus xianensis TaxID=1748249 RepID=A0ABR5SHJ9_9BACT|nr:hypothetical protein ASN18_0850 [Candidatus Magnetominusculus xianensis]
MLIFICGVEDIETKIPESAVLVPPTERLACPKLATKAEPDVWWKGF